MDNFINENLRKQEERIEKFLKGERTSNLLVMTVSNAKLLKEEYPHIKFRKREKINKKLGLYIYSVRRSSS